MLKLETRLLAAFAADPTGGNVGGVVYEDRELVARDRQQIAADLAVSTTAFVRDLGGRSFDVRFHSSLAEMAMCGHATVAAFSSLFTDGRIEVGTYTQRTTSGELQIKVETDGQVFMFQPLPKFDRTSVKLDEISSHLGIHTASIREIANVGTALRHLFVEVLDIDTLGQLKPEDNALRSLCAANGIDTIGVWSAISLNEGAAEYQLRDLCHGVGDPEEAASGTTNGALTCHLWQSGRVRANRNGCVVALGRQGFEMGRPSIVKTELAISPNGIEEVKVGGLADLRMKGVYLLHSQESGRS